MAEADSITVALAQRRKERRLVKMQQWLTSNADRIARLDKVQVTFHCAGGKVMVEVKERVEAR